MVFGLQIKKTKKKVLAFPKYGNTSNPFLININKYLEKDSELSIDEFRILMPFVRKYDIFHIHWPDYFFVKSFMYTLVRILYFFLIMSIFKATKTKMIWTVHNLQPHNNYHPRLYKFVMKIFTSFLESIIVMSEESKKLIYEQYPALINKKYHLIYHGLYDNYENTVSKEKARKKLGIDIDKKVLLFFGRIDEYKNIPILIDEFSKIENENFVLIIAGKIENKELQEEIKSKLNCRRIITFFNFIQDSDVQYFFNASDLIVLPFKNILNSGSAMLALSFKKPLLCPNKGSLVELANIFGDKTIITYEKFNSKVIEEALAVSLPPQEVILNQFKNRELSVKLKKVYLYS